MLRLKSVSSSLVIIRIGQPSIIFSQGLSVITYEFENVPVDAAAYLQERVPVLPGQQIAEGGARSSS